MKVVTYTSASLIALFPLAEFAPLISLNERKLNKSIGDRYSFGVIPDAAPSQAELAENGLVYESGVHETPEGDVTIARVSAHHDGVVIRASTTQQADAFFDDLQEWLIREWGFRRVPITPLYLSDIVVDFDKPMSNMINKFDEMINIISRNMNKNRQVKSINFQELSVGFETAEGFTPKFSIEHRVGSKPEDGKFFCTAPMETDKHVEALTQIEQLLS